MGYQVKWVTENLGVTRKALRVFEDHGLMPKPNGEKRDYTDEDIQRIWFIRVLQGIGFTLNEIETFCGDEDFDLRTRVASKIVELEEKELQLQQYIGYAKYIKLTGSVPLWPKEMGAVSFDEFQKNALESWNINEEPSLVHFQNMVDDYLSMPDEEFVKTNLARFIQFIESLDLSTTGIADKMSQVILPQAIFKRMHLHYSHPEVQLLVKLLYEEITAEGSGFEKMTVNQFVRFTVANYTVGDGAELNKKNFGKEKCDYIANAISVFGGFENYESII